VLDTDCVSFFLHRASAYPHLISRINAVPRVFLALSVVTIQENMRGAISLVEKNANGRRAVETYRFFCEVWESLHEFQVLPYTEAAERIFDSLPPEVKRKGPRDCRIAAIAIAHGAIVVTHNAQDFERIPGVTHVDWTVASDLADERTAADFNPAS
jgi:tRNA(fMet)-specific endonuclease VapC